MATQAVVSGIPGHPGTPGRTTVTVAVAVEHDACDERPGSRSEPENPHVSVSLGAGYLRMTAAAAARSHDTAEETAAGAEWLSGPISPALSLLALGARSQRMTTTWPRHSQQSSRSGGPPARTRT